MRNFYLLLTFFVSFLLQAQTGSVGIGTSNPQQKLHLDKSVGTLRIEGLDKNNNPTTVETWIRQEAIRCM